MKEAVKGRALVSMDALVQQTESSFTAGVLHFPLPARFRIPQIETFDEMKDPINHLIEARTYKKPSYHLLTIKQNSQKSLRSYV